ncbi:hypothetical protein [Sorangium sp. So ce406]
MIEAADAFKDAIPVEALLSAIGGAAPVHALAVAFDGKVVRVRAGEPG